jgi:hypothetical protein
MPKGYLEIKAEFIKKGYSTKEAEKHAAMIWNSKHKGKEAVHGGSDKDKK